jgi:hypothetical protein
MATACLGGLPAAISVLMFLLRAVLDADLMSAMGYSNLEGSVVTAAKLPVDGVDASRFHIHLDFANS